MKVSDEPCVKFIRMQSGEDLIAEVSEVHVDNEENYYIFDNPMKVIYTSTKEGYLSVSLMQWVFHHICEDQSFIIYMSDVITTSTPTESMIEYYWSTVLYNEEHLKQTKADSDISYDVIDDNEGTELLTDFLNSIKDIKKGTLH